MNLMTALKSCLAVAAATFALATVGGTYNAARAESAYVWKAAMAYQCPFRFARDHAPKTRKEISSATAPAGIRMRTETPKNVKFGEQPGHVMALEGLIGHGS